MSGIDRLVEGESRGVALRRLESAAQSVLPRRNTAKTVEYPEWFDAQIVALLEKRKGSEK